MTYDSNATPLPRRMLGQRLTKLRERRGMSRAVAAKRCEMGQQTLWRLESGRSSEIKRMVVNALCDLYLADDEDRRMLLWLAEESKKDGWWQPYTDAIAPDFEIFFGLEQAAGRIISWQSTTLPGLLQTPGYKRAMWEISTTLGRPVDFGCEIELLTKRQRHLQDPNFTFEALLSESALRYVIGGVEVATEQLNHLLEISMQANVSIRAVEFDAPEHLGLTSKDFVYMDFPEHPNRALNEPPVIYLEGLTGALYLDKAAEVQQYRAAYTDIRRVALSENGTRGLIEMILKEREA